MASPKGQSQNSRENLSNPGTMRLWLWNWMKECLLLAALKTFLNKLHKRWDSWSVRQTRCFIFTGEESSRMRTNSWMHSRCWFSLKCLNWVQKTRLQIVFFLNCISLKVDMHSSTCINISLLFSISLKKKGRLIFRPIRYLYKPAHLLCNHPLNSERQRILFVNTCLINFTFVFRQSCLYLMKYCPSLCLWVWHSMSNKSVCHSRKPTFCRQTVMLNLHSKNIWQHNPKLNCSHC